MMALESHKNLIEKYKTELDIPIIHVWQKKTMVSEITGF